jgi:hypothetical protein
MDKPIGKTGAKSKALALSIPLLGLASILPATGAAANQPSVKDRLASVRTIVAAQSSALNDSGSTRDSDPVPTRAFNNFNNFREVKRVD